MSYRSSQVSHNAESSQDKRYGLQTQWNQTSILDEDGEVISEGLSDLFVVIVSNNSNAAEESALMTLT